MSSSWAEAARFSYPMTQGSPLTLSNRISSPDPMLSGKSHWEAMCKSASSPHGPTNSSCSMNDLSRLLSSSIFETMPTVDFPQNTVTVAFKIFFLEFCLFIFGSAGCFVAVCGLSLIAVSQDYPLVAVFRLLTAVASHCSGLSLQWFLTVVGNQASRAPSLQ